MTLRPLVLFCSDSLELSAIGAAASELPEVETLQVEPGQLRDWQGRPPSAIVLEVGDAALAMDLLTRFPGTTVMFFEPDQRLLTLTGHHYSVSTAAALAGVFARLLPPA